MVSDRLENIADISHQQRWTNQINFDIQSNALSRLSIWFKSISRFNKNVTEFSSILNVKSIFGRFNDRFVLLFSLKRMNND